MRLPYQGEHGPPLDFETLVARNLAGDGAPLLAALRQDPHLAALDATLGFDSVVGAARTGGFQPVAFLEAGRFAVDRYVRRRGFVLKTVFTRDSNIRALLQQKLVALASALVACAQPATSSRVPRPSARARRVFGRNASEVPLARIRGATLLRTTEGALDAPRFAWRLATGADRRSAAAGTARVEFGRAIFVNDLDLDPVAGVVRDARAAVRPGHVRTDTVVKGVGATPYADNRFSRRKSGGLTVLQGERDWTHSLALARGGVPVYRPMELLLLPYCDWHPSMGWWPLVVYARVPLESLRVSDLDLLPERRARRVVAEVSAKLAALAGETDLDAELLVRFVVARLGRIAGLLEGGTTLGGTPFFHGFLHAQNVSLLGELVDLGEGRFVEDRRALRDCYARSGYVDPGRAWSPGVRHARDEVVAFREIARAFVQRVGLAVRGRPTRMSAALDRLFTRAYRDGRDGARADGVSELVGAATRTPRRAA